MGVEPTTRRLKVCQDEIVTPLLGRVLQPADPPTGPISGPISPELARLILLWPSLPIVIRNVIIVMVESVHPTSEGHPDVIPFPVELIAK